MYTEDPEAPMRRPAAGARQPSLALSRAAATADRWRGLPDGVTRWRLAAALRAAAKPLGLTSAMLRLIEHYIDLSYDQDWTPDSEPVICRPLVEIAEAMDLSERQVRNIERRLAEAGLLAFRDSANHHRRGRRDRRTGLLVYAYGPSLAPLGARADEIIALARSARAAIAEARRLRMAIAALRKRLLNDLGLAATAGIEVNDLTTAAATIPSRMLGDKSLEALAMLRDRLAELVEEAAGRIGGAYPTDEDDCDISAIQEMSSFQYTDTFKNNKTDISITSKTPQAKIEARHTEPQHSENEKKYDHGMSGVPLALVIAAAGPELRAAVARQGAPFSWRTLTDAARELAPLLGISHELWADACGHIGRGGAALSVALIERGLARSPSEGTKPIRRPDAYLRAMITRAKTGQLRLDRSLRAFAQRAAS